MANSFLASDDELYRRYRPFLMSLNPRMPLPRPTLYRPDEEIEPPALTVAPPPLAELPPVLAPPQPAEPIHPARRELDQTYGQMRELLGPPPPVSGKRKFWGAMLSIPFGPAAYRRVTGQTGRREQFHRLAGQAGLLQGELTREQQMQAALTEEAERRMRMTRDQAQADLYGAQAEAARRPKPEPATEGADTKEYNGKLYQWNPETRRYDIELGALPEPGLAGRDRPLPPEVEAQQLRIAREKERVEQGFAERRRQEAQGDKRTQKQEEAMARVASHEADLDRLAEVAQELQNHPGLGDAVGFRVGIQHIPGTAGASFRAKLESLKSQVAFGALQKMRETSKTGGALGQVSNIELSLLQNNIAGLDENQSEQEFIQALDKIVRYAADAKGRLRAAAMGEPEIRSGPVDLNQRGAGKKRFRNPTTGEEVEWNGREWVKVNPRR